MRCPHEPPPRRRASELLNESGSNAGYRVTNVSAVGKSSAPEVKPRSATREIEFMPSSGKAESGVPPGPAIVAIRFAAKLPDVVGPSLDCIASASKSVSFAPVPLDSTGDAWSFFQSVWCTFCERLSSASWSTPEKRSVFGPSSTTAAPLLAKDLPAGFRTCWEAGLDWALDRAAEVGDTACCGEVREVLGGAAALGDTSVSPADAPLGIRQTSSTMLSRLLSAVSARCWSSNA